MPDKELEQRQFDYFLEKTGLSFTSVDHRDKPDFLVCTEGRKIGIEITEGCSEELMRAIHLWEQNDMDSICISRLDDPDDGGRRSNEEILDSISISEVSEFNPAAIKWSARVASRIKDKIRRFREGTIESFDENWLVVVDSTPILADQAKNSKLQILLKSSIGEDCNKQPTFDLIYVVGSQNTFLFETKY